MRLRREGGDFQIKVTVDDGTATVNTIRTRLSAEDFIGEVIEVVDETSTVLEAVVTAEDGDDEVEMVSASYTLTYVPSTGAITAEEND